MNSQLPILVVGASGKFASNVAPALAQGGAPVCSLVRKPAQELELAAEGWFNCREVANLIGNIFGREIRAERIESGKARRASGDADDVHPLRSRRANNQPAHVRAILGREPRTPGALFRELGTST
jgi:hypothetical protein